MPQARSGINEGTIVNVTADAEIVFPAAVFRADDRDVFYLRVPHAPRALPRLRR